MRDVFRTISGYLLLLLFSVSVSAATWFSIQSRVLMVFLSALTAWISFATAHRQLTGELVHKSDEEIEMRGPDNLQRKIGVSVGFTVSLSAFPTCILAVNTMNFPLLTLGYVLFFSGYVIMHYNWFGDPI